MAELGFRTEQWFSDEGITVKHILTYGAVVLTVSHLYNAENGEYQPNSQQIELRSAELNQKLRFPLDLKDLKQLVKSLHSISLVESVFAELYHGKNIEILLDTATQN